MKQIYKSTLYNKFIEYERLTFMYWIRDICFSKLILRLNNLLADLRNWLYTNKKIEYLPDLYFCRDLLKYR